MTRGVNAKNLIRAIGIILFFVVLIGYGIFSGKYLLFGITLSVSGITDGMTTENELLDIEGHAKRAIEITINGGNVSVSGDGSWRDTLALSPGDNRITVTAKDKFGKVISKEYRIYYKAPPAPPSAPSVDMPSEVPVSEDSENKVE